MIFERGASALLGSQLSRRARISRKRLKMPNGKATPLEGDGSRRTKRTPSLAKVLGIVLRGYSGAGLSALQNGRADGILPRANCETASTIQSIGRRAMPMR